MNRLIGLCIAVVMIVISGITPTPAQSAEEACNIEECYAQQGTGCGGYVVPDYDHCVYEMDCGHGEFCGVVEKAWCDQNCW